MPFGVCVLVAVFIPYLHRNALVTSHKKSTLHICPRLPARVHTCRNLALTWLAHFLPHRFPYAVARRYLRSWFVVDFISCIPFEMTTFIFPEGPQGQTLKPIKMLRMIRLLKLARIAKV